MAYVNNDGLTIRYGAEQGARGSKAGVTTGAGKLRELVLTIDLVALGAGGTGFTADLNNDGVNEAFGNAAGASLNTALPANALIHSARMITLTTPAGGTDFVVGTYRADGTVVSANGILTTAGTVQGAQVGTQVAAGTAPWYVAAKATGTYTAGKVKVIVEYMTV